MENNDTSLEQHKEQRYWFERALNLLMRREHSAVELKQKLVIKGCNDQWVDQIIERCIELNYLSLERFAEVFARNQAQLGYGPQKIKFLLKQHHIPNEVVSIALEEIDFEHAYEVALRKIGNKPEQKLKAALYRRGF